MPPENEPDDHPAQRLAESPVVTTSLVEDCTRLYFEVGHERANYAALLHVVLLVADRLAVSEIDPDRPGEKPSRNGVDAHGRMQEWLLPEGTLRLHWFRNERVSAKKRSRHER